MNNLSKRVIVSLVAIPILIFLVYIGHIYFLILCIVIQSICLYEFFKIFHMGGYNPMRVFPIFLSSVIFVLNYFKNPNILLYLIIFFFLILTVEIFRSEKRNPVNALINISGFVYISVPFLLLFELDANYVNVVYLLIMIWVNDISAYFTGKFLGKHKLTSLSPNKTIEGSVAGILFTLIASLTFWYLNENFISVFDAVVLALLVGFFGQIGDIFESSLKRIYQIKDSSGFLPGHGGLLDRFDNLIFSVPVMYVYLNIL